MLHPASQLGSPCCWHLCICHPFWGSGFVMLRAKFSVGTSVNVVLPSRAFLPQLSVTKGVDPGRVARGRCPSARGVAPAALELGGPWNSRGSSSPPALPALRSAACYRGLAGPTCWSGRSGLAHPLLPAWPSSAWPASPSRDGDWSTLLCPPPLSPAHWDWPWASALSPPLLSPEHLAPFSSHLQAFTQATPAPRDTALGVALLPWPSCQHLRSRSPFRAPLLGGTSHLLAACVS